MLMHQVHVTGNPPNAYQNVLSAAAVRLRLYIASGSAGFKERLQLVPSVTAWRQ